MTLLLTLHSWQLTSFFGICFACIFSSVFKNNFTNFTSISLPTLNLFYSFVSIDLYFCELLSNSFKSFPLKIHTSKDVRYIQAVQNNTVHMHKTVSSMIFFFLFHFLFSFFPPAGLPVGYLAGWQKVDSDTGSVGLFWSERVRVPLESSPCPSGRR